MPVVTPRHYSLATRAHFLEVLVLGLTDGTINRWKALAIVCDLLRAST